MSNHHIHEGGTGVTNFDLDMVDIYIEAVIRSGHKYLVVSDQAFGLWRNDPNYCSLHDLSKFGESLSKFWCIFEEVKKERGYKYSWERKAPDIDLVTKLPFNRD
jgi:hypothetical protein